MLVCARGSSEVGRRLRRADRLRCGVDVDVSDVKELHYITPIENLPSILKYGILSHRRVEKLDHKSVAMADVQARRAAVRIPGGRPLHEYANLYFNARK